MAGLLPESSDPGTWQPEGAPQIFAGDDLFVYIDGGAEIYREYGFLRAIVQDYKDASGNRVSLEIFEMASAESAYGIYTFKSAPGGTDLKIGDDCQVADYYLNFRKGRFLLTATGLDKADETRRGLIQFARTVEKKIAEGAPRPALVSLLPQEGLQPQSLKFFKGPLGLYNSYPFATADVFALERGVKGDYDSGGAVYLFEYSDEKKAGQSLDRAAREFARSQKFHDFVSAARIFKFKDEKGRWLIMSLHKHCILIALSGREFERAEDLITRTRERIR